MVNTINRWTYLQHSLVHWNFYLTPVSLCVDWYRLLDCRFLLGLAEPEKTYVVTSNDKQKIRILLQINVLCTKLWFFSTINHPLNIKKLRRRSVSFFNNRKMSTKPNHYTTPLSILIHNGTLTYLWTASRLCGQVDTHQSGCTDVCLLEIVVLFSTTHFDDTLLWQ